VSDGPSNAWGWTSRTASGGLSILAIAETVIASGTSIGIAIYFETVLHILIASLIAPLFMLRSEASVAGAAAAFEKTLDGVKQTVKERGQAFEFPILTLFPRLLIGSIWLRIYHTLANLRPGMARLSGNYSHALVKSDSASGVTLVPDTTTVHDILEDFTSLPGNPVLATFVGAIFLVPLLLNSYIIMPLLSGGGTLPYLLSIGLAVVQFFLFVCVFIVATGLLFSVLALWLRWSVKSTALIWLPLIYLASRAPRTLASATEAIREERASALAALLRLLAWFSLAFFLWRAVVFPSTAAWWEAQDWAKPLLVFILPLGTEAQELHLWHLASGVSAFLTLVTYYLLWERRGRVDATATEITPGITKLYTGYFWTRGAISIYSIACGLWFAYLGVQLIDLPDLSGCVFPWQTGCS